jgi:hypothetical protein
MTQKPENVESGRREMLRHTLATLAYRAAKAVRDAPESFGEFSAGDSCRTPVQILAHMGDLFDWAVSLAKGEHVWHDSTPLPWPQEVERFFTALEALDRCLASDTVLGSSEENLFQGPIADALTHTGQIAMLRRMAGSRIKGENYFKAQIERGHVSQVQPPSIVEFD